MSTLRDAYTMRPMRASGAISRRVSFIADITDKDNYYNGKQNKWCHSVNDDHSYYRSLYKSMDS